VSCGAGAVAAGVELEPFESPEDEQAFANSTRVPSSIENNAAEPGPE
jgi:hypothetical protein